MSDQTNQNDDRQSGGDGPKRGFAAMDEDRQREIAAKGGASVSDEDRSFSKDSDLAAEAGRKGGESSRGAGSSRSDDGGSASSGRDDDTPGRTASADNRADGRGGDFADDPERAAEAGRKGGEASGGGR